MNRKYLFTFLVGLGYLYLGVQLLNLSPLIVPENAKYFGMVFDLLHYTFAAIPAAILITVACRGITDTSIVISLLGAWAVSSIGAILFGAWSIAIANLLIYTIWLFGFIFVVRAFNKPIQSSANSR
jgi:hypothetical protein